MRSSGAAPGEWVPSTLDVLEAALREDLGGGDVTTARVVSAGVRGRGRVQARERGVWSGGAAASWVFRRLDPDLRVELPLAEGDRFEAGDEVLRVSGALAPILSGERLALNLIQRLCGVATLTRRFVDAVAGTGAAILDTRKTTPGLRELERAAVRAGGGRNHRWGLHDAVLVKENHVTAAGGVATAWRRAVTATDDESGAGPAFVEIEVRNAAELEEARLAGARHVLLDNFALDELRRAVTLVRARTPGVVLEASGGVTIESVRAIAETGVDHVSVGSLTHGARALDLSLLVEVDP